MRQETGEDLAQHSALPHTQLEAAAAYVFGSVTAGRARDESDGDVAVLLKDDSSAPEMMERRLELRRTLEASTEHAVDLAVLNDASPVLQAQVLRKGGLVYQRGARPRIAFEVCAGKMYADRKPMCEFFRRALVRDIEGGLSRPSAMK